MAEKRNDLRIPFAEWLYRMHEADLAPQARALAVYVAAFKINNNDELSGLSGIADKTYNKWKRELLKDGWVIISRRAGGRGIGIEVQPAYRETPVTFTDVVARNPGKFYQGNEDGDTPVISTDQAKETGVISPEVPVSSHARGVGNNINKTNNYPMEGKDRGFGGKEPDHCEEQFALQDEKINEIELQVLEAYNLYNAAALQCKLQQAARLTETRKKGIKARLKDYGAPKASGLQAWKQALSNIEKSAYLRGEGGGRAGWKADLDFLIQASRFTKVVEGGYGNGAHAAGAETLEEQQARYAKIIEDQLQPEKRQ